MENTTILSKDYKISINIYTLIWSLLLLVAVPFAYLHTRENVLYNFYLILISPSKLVTDYFNLGGLAASFLNAGICGLFCNLMVGVFKLKPKSSTLVGYFLVIAHCFYGLNFLNMMLPFFGIIIYCLVRKKKIAEHLHIAMFSTALAPFISDFLFRYTLPEGAFVFGSVQLTFGGVALAIIFSILSAFIIPAIIPGTEKMYKGYNLFKAGLAIGFFGTFAHALFYDTLGIPSPDSVVRDNPIYNNAGNSYEAFVITFFAVAFILTLVIGFFGNNKSLKGYSKIWKCNGWKDDFYDLFGPYLTYVNVGIYGIAMIIFQTLIYLFAKGAGFTGPTTGIIIASITFTACGQTVRNVWPIALGYIIIVSASALICSLLGMPIVWVASSQVYINGFAFATGLCPFSGRYGWKIGTIAGMICAVLCMVTLFMHDGFVLYNGGLTSGLTAMILLPILEFYKVKVKENRD